LQEAKVFPCYDRNERGKGAFGMDKEEIFARRLDNSKKKREVVTKEAVSAHKEKQTELPDQDPTDKKELSKKDPSKKNSDRTE
jgi:hypothetical protein